MYGTVYDMADMIIAEDLRKRFRSVSALDGFDLSVPAGTVHGLLGRNGAGKTTAVKILTTLLRPSGGRAVVAGYDVVRRPSLVRQRIGLVGQHPAIDEALSGRQNLELFARLYHLGAAAAARKASSLLADFGLADTGNKPASQYSGGMRRRLDLAASMILAPEVLFLDEPTTGLDPRGRAEVWTTIRTLVAAGTTVLLTTQYLDEADQLANHISIIDRGRVISSGTPDALKSTLGGDRLDIVLHSTEDLAPAAAILTRISGTDPESDRDSRRLSSPISDRVTALTAAVRALADAGIQAEDITIRRPTLDEAFLHITDQVPA
jgi:ABC-2 type transport system ATP-binding protein